MAIRLAVDVMKRAQVTRHQIGWMKLIEHQDVGPDQNVGSDISKKQEKTVAWELRKFFLCRCVYTHIYAHIYIYRCDIHIYIYTDRDGICMFQ